MTDDKPMIQLPQSEYLRLLTAAVEYHDDKFDQDMELNEFEKLYRDESDTELERKRTIMRNRILAKHEPERSRNRYEILTEIIKANARRRHVFERQKELNQWLRVGAAGIVGALLGWLAKF